MKNDISKSPNAISAMKSGISLSFLRMHLEHNFNIPAPLVEQCLEEYYVLYWKPRYFRNQLTEGLITRLNTSGKVTEHIKYMVRYKDCTLASISKLNQIKLSFRMPKVEYPACNYVLIMPGNEGDK